MGGLLQLNNEPAVDDFEYDEMMFRIYDSTQFDYPIAVTWMTDAGTIESGWGVIREIDADRMRVKLVCDWDTWWIDLVRLCSVSKVMCSRSE
ncbi:hypothetical protein ACTID9_12895 [Brevibacillus fluminis]|uniref:hypothetical protein n=1 Tax=Brevibacillus fluminis TaxID=511487 RepID=UPI003F8BA51E